MAERALETARIATVAYDGRHHEVVETTILMLRPDSSDDWVAGPKRYALATTGQRAHPMPDGTFVCAGQGQRLVLRRVD